ncbi:hypothetical protein O6H91_18G076800 [Diphasiastrum complanatum]|uniref:Uncharacterized protein n=1 Tax=Diphasiastrum complanatum TaxID=34168 RepID=A0ACC2B2T9_DIPCM|nr:hypothetical protein O6H91_18G076800 [Diphasiastrum complanatum]
MAIRDGGAVRSESAANFLNRRTRRISPKVVIKTKQILSKQAEKIVKQADEHEQFLNKIKYCVGVFCFGTFCYLLGSRPQDIPKLYCLFFLTIAPLRWVHYRIRKWHYYLLDFCYYANVIFMVMLMYFPNNEKLFMICFSFSEGPLSWALIVWRCSLVFSSFDKIISVLIHLLPGTVFFIIRWWDPITFPRHSAEATGPWPAWPVVMTERALWTWLFMVPLVAYTVWQILYFVIVNGLRRQRLLNDPEIMTSYRELSRKASKANNIWWRLSGLLGDENRVVMYAVLQALFTVATMALTVPMFKSYRMHIAFELLKVVASIWNGGNFFFEVMPHEVGKKKKRAEAKASSSNLDDLRHDVKELSSDNHFNSTVPLLNATDYSGVLKAENQLICALCRQASSPVSEFKDLVKEMNECLKRDQSQLDQPEADATGTKLCKLLSLRRHPSGCSDKVDSRVQPF